MILFAAPVAKLIVPAISLYWRYCQKSTANIVLLADF
jgi:hypothetical protein